MSKLIAVFIISVYTLLSPVSVKAAIIDVPQISYGNIAGGNSMQKLSDNIYKMAKQINRASSELMKFGDMLYCSSLHGKAADWKFDIMGWSFDERIIAIQLFFSSLFLLAIGFIVSLIASFYMFDIAFNLSISLSLLPLGIALWPFGWTKNKLKVLIENITYYVGVFIFLPLGIIIDNEIVQLVLVSAFGSESDLVEAFKNDQADLIEEKLALFSLSFLKVILSYLVAIRIIPLFAQEFCQHFFGNSIAGAPISQYASQLVSKLKKTAMKKVGTYGMNTIKNGGRYIKNKFK